MNLDPWHDCEMIDPRPRDFPPGGTTLPEAVVDFLGFVQTTTVNKLAGLSEEQARATPIPSSPLMSPLGLVKHMTAVLRQHIQIHIGGRDLPPLWCSDDRDHEFRLEPDDTIVAVVASFDEECRRSQTTLAASNMDAAIVTYGKPNRVGRLLIDVLQESARHLGHLDIMRELIDGSKGE